MTRVGLLLLAASLCHGQNAAEPKYEMDRYVVVVLRKGPSWTGARTPESQQLQKDHLAHIRRMAEAGKLIVAGPFLANNDDARGLFIFRGTLEEARELAEADPAVKAGQMKLDYYPWLAGKGLRVDPPLQ